MAEPPADGIWLGVDLGTQGVRALAATTDGQVLGRGSVPLTGRRHGDLHEQDPEDWWSAVRGAVRAAVRLVPTVHGVAVCSTSGTLLLTDRHGNPVTPGVMYDDGRARTEAREAQEAGTEVWDRLGHRIQPSWALAKLVWLVRRLPRGDVRIADVRIADVRLAHQADLIARRLVGVPVATDSSHALKSGYDLGGERWPLEVFAALGLAGSLFPPVVRPGARLGEVSAAAAEETGLPSGIPVIAGMTDGCASQLGAGALRVGRWNSVLGTTLVLKGVTSRPVRDPSGVMYNHRSADGTWLPGGASSVGAGALTKAFPDGDLTGLDARLAGREPAAAVAYPLISTGERFPFLVPDAVPFVLGRIGDDLDRYSALLQGVAMVERLCLDYVRYLGAPVEGPITFTGGGTRSDYWSRLRADVLGRSAEIPEHAEPALGMAMLAAYGAAARGSALAVEGSPLAVRGSSLADVAERMVRTRTVIDPRDDGRSRLIDRYLRLVAELERRGWLAAPVAAYAREQSCRRTPI